MTTQIRPTPVFFSGRLRRLSYGPVLLALVTLTLVGADETDPDTATFSLRDALAATLEKNPALRVKKSVIEQKSGVLEQAGGMFDWTATGAASYTRDRTPVPGPPGTAPENRSNTTAYTVGIDRLLRTGVLVQSSATVAVEESLAPAGPTYGVSELNLQIIVPLLRGLGRDSTGAFEAAARGEVEVARLLYQHSLTAQTFHTAFNYWASRSADETLNVQRDVERAAEQLVESTKVLVRSGVFPPAYLLQAEANLREKRTVRINAELEAHDARFSLGQSIGLPPESIATTPAPADPFPSLEIAITPFDQESRTALIVRALHNRADYLASQQSLVPLGILARQAEFNLKPEVNLVAGVGYHGLNAGSSRLAPLHERLTGLNAEVGVSFAWPFRNTYQRGLLRERRADQALVEAEVVQLAQSVAREVLLALEELRLRADTVRSAEETVQIAQRAVAAQYDQLKAGDGTILDLINLENLYSSARIRYIHTHASYAIAIARLRYALGLVFEKVDETLTLADLTAVPAL